MIQGCGTCNKELYWCECGKGPERDFDPSAFPKLKPCPKCGGKMQYWDDDVAVCLSNKCPFMVMGFNSIKEHAEQATEEYDDLYG